MPGTTRDKDGHGTHTASTAAGNVVSGASYFGLAAGTTKGGSPESRLAIYKVCNGFCSGSAILAAFDDAISDGVDVLSLSLGGFPDPEPDLKTDVIAIGAFHAVERGIVVVCAAGNSGPKRSTLTNDAPWILTVAATTIDREFQSNIVLGNKEVIKVQFYSAHSTKFHFYLFTLKSVNIFGSLPFKNKQINTYLQLI